MPHKIIQCCICKEEVTKRSTLETETGKRACKKHPETQFLSKKKQYHEFQIKKKTEQKKREKRKAKKEYLPLFDNVNSFGDPILHCYRCNKEGIRADIYSKRSLIDIHKKKLIREKQDGILDFQTKDFAKKIGGIQLHMFSCKEPCIKNMSVYWKYKEIKQQMKIILLCSHCADRQKVPKHLYMPSQEQLIETMSILTLSKDDLDYIAQKEIDEDSKNP